ncbi:MAG: hypothetical protein ACLRSW_02720 [Christensenellaceae bacterium]
MKAVHTVDECVKKVTDKILAMGGSALVTADHGNADQMIADDGVTPFTQHTTNPVPVILVSEKYKSVKLRDGGVLADLAPTLLDMMNLPQPGNDRKDPHRKITFFQSVGTAFPRKIHRKITALSRIFWEKIKKGKKTVAIFRYGII